MGDSPRRRRYSESPSPRRRYSRSRSPVRRYSRSPPRRENGGNEDATNPGNNLYVTGLSTRVTERDLEEHFSREGKVTECRLVVDPRSRESRGFGFVTMESLEDAERCIKYLNRSTLEGRIITVEKKPSGREQGHLLLVLILVSELRCVVIHEDMVVTMIENEIGTETHTALDGRHDILRIGVVGNVTGSVSVIDHLVILGGLAMVVIGHVLPNTHLTDADAPSAHYRPTYLASVSKK